MLFISQIAIISFDKRLKGNDDMGRLDGKVVLITGASRGIGLSGVKLMAAEGAKVVATTGHRVELLEKEVKPFNDAHGHVTVQKLNVADAADWQRVVKETVAQYGTIDVLVNNAGSHVTKSLLETSEDDWDFIMNVNAKGVWLGMKTVIPVMLKNNDGKGKGSIINTSSVAALMGGYSDAGSVSYSASKGAVDAMTRHAAQWYAQYNIRVNNVNPGPIFTGMVEDSGIHSQKAMGDLHKGRINLPPYAGEPDDIGYAFVYLASDESKFMTGSDLVIDGGWSTNSFVPEKNMHDILKH